MLIINLTNIYLKNIRIRRNFLYEIVENKASYISDLTKKPSNNGNVLNIAIFERCREIIEVRCGILTFSFIMHN